MPLKLKGFSAHICCDGKELEQYDVQLEDERTVTCWIPSESGKAFSVHWKEDASPTPTLMQVTTLVDGRCVARHKDSGFISGLVDRPGQVRPLLFSQLKVTDDEAVASSSPSALRLDKLGAIEVEMRRVDAYHECEDFFSMGEVPEIGPVHEKSKKAGVHAVSIGAAAACKPTRKMMAIGLQNQPFAVFKFLYRPIELLRANDIAPRPPTANKRPSEARDAGTEDAGPSDPKRARRNPEEEHEVKAEQTDGEDEDEDRVTFLQEHIMMLQTQLAQAQAKKSKTVVKREASPIHVPVDWANEVIDLT
ncbi:hypothetical protein LXA43DRAFT_989893 [Ganoderma leucocontextum]|nr:hypothetical protein LXA43DRAFT_989893 [Ganoderma leucocontextum]